MNVILFVDMLGARKKYETGGVAKAFEAFEHFSRLVVAAIRKENLNVIRGGIETDSAMLVFDSAISALKVAQRLFLWSFTNKNHPSAPRLWLRGSLVEDGVDEYVRRGTNMSGKFADIQVFTYSANALDAMSLEKSGYKGMRLLVRSSLATDVVKNAFRLPFGEMYLNRLRRLRHCVYPAGNDDLVDFLWMAAVEESDWSDISLHMTSRLRHSTKDQEEFAQAAATQVLFHECGALRQGAISRGKRIENAKG